MRGQMDRAVRMEAMRVAMMAVVMIVAMVCSLSAADGGMCICGHSREEHAVAHDLFDDSYCHQCACLQFRAETADILKQAGVHLRQAPALSGR